MSAASSSISQPTESLVKFCDLLRKGKKQSGATTPLLLSHCILLLFICINEVKSTFFSHCEPLFPPVSPLSNSNDNYRVEIKKVVLKTISTWPSAFLLILFLDDIAAPVSYRFRLVIPLITFHTAPQVLLSSSQSSVSFLLSFDTDFGIELLVES